MSRQGDQRDHTTESHRTPAIEVHTTKTATKTKHQEEQKQTKRVTYNGETIKRNGTSPLKELNGMEITKFSDTEFRIMVIKMPKELTDNCKELSENYVTMKKEIETINKNQEEMNNKILEIKNTQEGIISRLDKQRL